MRQNTRSGSGVLLKSTETCIDFTELENECVSGIVPMASNHMKRVFTNFRTI